MEDGGSGGWRGGGGIKIGHEKEVYFILFTPDLSLFPLKIIYCPKFWGNKWFSKERGGGNDYSGKYTVIT